MLLVANKIDLTYNRRVNGQEGYQLAEELKVEVKNNSELTNIELS